MLKPCTYYKYEAIEKEFNRFQDTAMKEGDKYEKLLTFITGGTFVISTSILSFFSTYSNKNVHDFTLLKFAWFSLIISFLCGVVDLRLSADFHDKYSKILSTKIMEHGKMPIEINEKDVKDCNLAEKRALYWHNGQLVFWLVGMLLLVYFFVFY